MRCGRPRCVASARILPDCRLRAVGSSNPMRVGRVLLDPVNRMRKLLLMTSLVAASVALGAQDTAPNLDRLKMMTARFAPVDLSADVSKLPAHERQALGKLVESAKVMDALFLRQVWAGN